MKQNKTLLQEFEELHMAWIGFVEVSFVKPLTKLFKGCNFILLEVLRLLDKGYRNR